MEAPQHDEHAGEQQPDPVGAETGPIAPPEADTSDRPAEEKEGFGSWSETPPVVESDPTQASSSPAPEEADGDAPESDAEGREGGLPKAEREDEPGILTGTAEELAPGVGGAGEHPAPAAVRNPDGSLHVAGEPPVGNVASGLAGSELEETPSGATDEGAREALNAEQEPEQIETERPDLGTE